MKISERATNSIREMPERDRPVSEEFRIIAKEWTDLDGAARMLEGCREAVLSQMMRRLGDISVSRAEREVKASEEWADYIRKMVDARTAANVKRVHLEWLRMRQSEWIAADANARVERRL